MTAKTRWRRLLVIRTERGIELEFAPLSGWLGRLWQAPLARGKAVAEFNRRGKANVAVTNNLDNP